MLNFILPFIVLIVVVVFIHEYGHYYFAKRYGVGETDFSIGFGRELFGWNDKSGTRWKVCWIPLGGYVKFFGDRNVFSQADQEELLKKYFGNLLYFDYIATGNTWYSILSVFSFSKEVKNYFNKQLDNDIYNFGDNSYKKII